MAVIGTWRILVNDEARRLEAELFKIRDSGTPAAQSPAYVAASEAINEAREAAGLPATPGTARGGRWNRFVGWLIGDSVEVAWVALHRAREAMLSIVDDASAAAMAIGMTADLAMGGSDPNDTRVPVYRDLLAEVAKGAGVSPPPQVTFAQREVMREILRMIQTGTDTAHANVRSFRNVVALAGLLVLVGTITVAVVAAWDPIPFDLCGAQASGPRSCISGDVNPGPLDVAYIELLGALGGLVVGARSLSALQGYRGAYSLPVIQALFKLPMGAATAMVAVLLVQHSVLDFVTPQSGTRILAYAALFGFAQQLVTGAIDSRAEAILSKARSKDDSAKRPASSALNTTKPEPATS
jgi:hypothetical protein